MSTQRKKSNKRWWKPVFKHGLYEHRVYKIWSGMKQRCYNVNNNAFSNYGGRGIFVCEEWRRSFDNFLRDMGHPPTEAHTLERIDNNGPYTPKNCRWATRKEQAQNRRMLTYKGKSIDEWTRELGCGKDLIHGRLRKGWSIERAVSEIPFKGKNGNSKLSYKDAVSIRLLGKNEVRGSKIAARFDVSQATISAILNNRIWKNPT